MKHDNVDGFPGYYLSKSGKLWRHVGTKWIRCKEYLSPKGYLHVNLNGPIKRLNRLVAKTYLPNPHNLPVVMHLDNNKLNNSITNLKWGTYKENSQQMMREGRNKGQYVSKLSSEQQLEVVRLYDTGNYTLKELSIKFNCGNMSRIVRRTREKGGFQ